MGYIFLVIFAGIFAWSFVVHPIYCLVRDALRFRKLEPHLNSIEKWKKEKGTVEEETIVLHKALDEYRQATERIIAEKTIAFPWLAHAFADYHAVLYDRLADTLISKQHPAPLAADAVRAAKAEMHKAKLEAKAFEYRVYYYESLFPWLEEFIDPELPDDLVATDPQAAGSESPDRKWLTQAEWAALDEIERSELAFERYLDSRKSNWHIGRDYEQYVGYLLETDGFDVEYCGMELKLQDLGRDLVATRGDEVIIVQCKNWSKEKTIHEKHVFQLYGTFVLYCMAHPDQQVSAHFYTSTCLSETAKEVAGYLEVNLKEDFKMGEYPRIKCNINRSTGERIFHLPFDQQYDRTRVNKYSGECHVFTVKEAYENGFRRAMRYSGPMG